MSSHVTSAGIDPSTCWCSSTLGRARMRASISADVMAASLLDDLLDDGAGAFEGHALHVEGQAAEAAQLLAAAGAAGAAVDEHGQDGAGAGRRLRDPGAAQEDA